MYVIKNSELGEIKLSKLTNIVYVRRRNYHFNTLFYSLVALLTLMIIENKYVVSIHVYLKIYSASIYYRNVF
jgi:hypothetical protein